MSQEGFLMKRILLDNAYEAWSSAIRYHDAIEQGIATLFYQKSFITSLHNAVEIFFKQILLDESNRDVAWVGNVKSQKNVVLNLNYNGATDLNRFFGGLTPEELNEFKTITFSKLIDLFGEVVLKNGNKVLIRPELKLLQKLRNNETHFMISQSNFLTESAFKELHNFMIQFYVIMKDRNLLPFWGDAWGEDKKLVFERTPISFFSYIDSLKKSSLAQSVVNHLNGTYDYGSPSCTSYDIATELCRRDEQMEPRFNDVWAIINVLQGNDLIHYEEFVEELPDEFELCNQHPNVYYLMAIDL